MMGIHHDPGGYPFVKTPLAWPAPGEPQTAISDGHALHPAFDHGEVLDLASLDRARLRHMRRRAMDAVDRLIVLLDALDVDAEDMEPDDPEGTDLDAGEGQLDDDEPTLGAPEVDPLASGVTWRRQPYSRTVRRSSAGAQTIWSGISTDDREADPLDCGEEQNEDGDSLDGGEHDLADCEPYLGAPEQTEYGHNGWGINESAYGPDVEDVNGIDRLEWEAAHA